MLLYRLVGAAYDPITPGHRLSRISSHSLQKMGRGMYLTLDPWSALRFAIKGRSGHVYTHLVQCDVPFTIANFFDERAAPNAIAQSPFRDKQTAEEKFVGFCKANGFAGMVWGSVVGWTEVVIHEAHIGSGFVIVDVAELI